MQKRGRPPLRSRLRAARARLVRELAAVWARDRALLPRGRALLNRAARICVAALVGLRRHRLTSRAAALTYYTVFSVVPVLVVTLGLLKMLRVIPLVRDRLPSELEAKALDGNQLLGTAMRAVLTSVERAQYLASGVLGLAALCYGVARLVANVNGTINDIASSQERRPLYSRVLGYLVVFTVAPVLVALGSLLGSLAHGPLRHALAGVLRAMPHTEVWLAGGLALSGAWIALTFLYGAAARARIPMSSAACGAAVAALALAVVVWGFAWLQIGVAGATALESGFAALPVFLLWVYSSWMVILAGAEVAVAHALDRTLVHGAVAGRLGPSAEIGVGIVVMALFARVSLAGGPRLSVEALAREMRVLPRTLASICQRLARAGLLARGAPSMYRLTCDLDATRLSDVARALAREPSDSAAEEALGAQAAPEARPFVQSWFDLGRDGPSDVSLKQAALLLRGATRPTPAAGAGRAARLN
jgi:membrane protein